MPTKCGCLPLQRIAFGLTNDHDSIFSIKARIYSYPFVSTDDTSSTRDMLYKGIDDYLSRKLPPTHSMTNIIVVQTFKDACAHFYALNNIVYRMAQMIMFMLALYGLHLSKQHGRMSPLTSVER
ncbi:hypothetical protein V6N12_045914 [Hibiscus sabdariffa]|uniref:Uncharacterized protein n=1 Tax=Hibiscus sabdariffa TaxID=183260 RepID=A0ABR2G456_9ROSI